MTTTAPSGVTQRGLFNLESDEDVNAVIGGSISFPLTLASAPTVVEVPDFGTNPDPTTCPGNATAPAAAAGYLCIYDSADNNTKQTNFGNLYIESIGASQPGADTFGALISAQAAVSGIVQAIGSWAVTAP